MFLHNKYTRWYNTIVSNPDKSATYTEDHHIIPRSLGGSNAKSNRVRLSARQHFVAHLLLTRMVTGLQRHKMIWALHRMAFGKGPDHQRNFKAVEYETARKLHRENVTRPKSAEHQAKISFALRGQTRTAEARKKISDAAKLRVYAKHTAEHTEKIAAKLKGVAKSEEHKQKLREAALGRGLSDAAKLKISLAQKGKPKGPMSDETKAKISAARRLRSASPIQ